MSLQLIKDSNGINTGVFIPIQEWNEISQKHTDLLELIEPEIFTDKEIAKMADNFVLSKKQLELLEEARNAEPEQYLSLDNFNHHLKATYGV